MSLGLFDYEKVNNRLIKALQEEPALQDLLQAITYRKATLLVPQNVSIQELRELTAQFVRSHIALTNTQMPDEFAVLSGALGIFFHNKDVLMLHVLPSQLPSGDQDRQSLFDAARPYYAAYRKGDAKPRQTIQVLRDGEAMVGKSLIRILLISEPVEIDGCYWSKERLAAQLKNSGSDTVTKGGGSKIKGFFSGLTKIGGSGSSPSPADSPQAPGKAVASNASPTPKTTKDVFLQKIQSAPEILGNVKKFLSGFLNKPPVPEEQPKIVKRFIDDTLAQIAAHKLWKGANEEELDIAAEWIEKYAMLKIYNCCFSPSVDDIERDKAIHKRMQHLQFVSADHLDISEKHRDNAKLDLAIEELRKIAQYKAPRDKVVCVLNCCKLIYGILNKASASGHPAGADDFLPLLIYVVLRANPPQMHSNLQYILKFRSPSKMISEAGYYFTHLESTIDFIEHLDASKLTIDPQDFERLLAQAQQQTAARHQNAPSPQDPQKSVELERLPSIVEPSVGSGSSPSLNSSGSTGFSTDSLLMDFGDTFTSSAPAPMARVSPNPSGGMAGSPDLLQLSKSSSTAVSRSDERLSRQSSGSMQQFDFDDDSTGPEKFLKIADASQLLVGDLPMLLSSFKQLYYENQRMRAELAAAKFDVLKR